MRGKEAADEKLKAEGINVEWVIKWNLIEGDPVAVANEELVEDGCEIIFNNSYGHEPAMLTVAAEYPDVQFVGMTNQGSRYDDLANTHNAFANIYEGRYVAGVAAGLKMQQECDRKWLVSCADTALNGSCHTLRDYSRELEQNLTIHCYQPESGYCACLLLPED